MGLVFSGTHVFSPSSHSFVLSPRKSQGQGARPSLGQRTLQEEVLGRAGGAREPELSGKRQHWALRGSSDWDHDDPSMGWGCPSTSWMGIAGGIPVTSKWNGYCQSSERMSGGRGNKLFSSTWAQGFSPGGRGGSRSPKG